MSRQDSRQISDVKIMLKTGVDGSGIASIEKTGSQGNVDTYTITFDDGRKTTFTVTNGNGITNVEKTATSGLVDTYTITFDNGTTETFTVTNGADGGMSAKFLITSETGSTVTVTTPSGIVITPTQVTGSTTQWECESTEYGNHIVESDLNGVTAQTTVSVDTCKVYNVNANHFSATITVTYPSGATCTCIGGSESYTATGSPYTFTVHSANTFTITATDGSDTATDTVTITTSGQSENISLSFNPTATVTLYSAVNDTIYYYEDNDTSGSPITLCTTNNSGSASNVEIENGIIYYSTVAKNPDNLANAFSKEAVIDGTESTWELMPDGEIVYWYGFTNSTFYGYPFLFDNNSYGQIISPIMNTNNIYISGTDAGDHARTTLASQSSIDVTNYDKLKTINGANTAIYSYLCMCSDLSVQASFVGNDTPRIPISANDNVSELNISSVSGNYYPACGFLHDTFNYTLKAMWLE